MEAGKKKITDIFNGGRLLKVPFFQRAYVWGEEQWERLLADMEFISKEYADEEHGYFLGSIILKQELGPVDSSVSDTRTIVDGQQRLTTIAIFLKVLYLQLNRDTQFRRKFCLDDDDETVAIKHSHIDCQDFEHILHLKQIENINGNSNIIKAYNYFKKNIKIEKLDINSILRNVLFVVIDLGANEDEQLIFDTINSLGVRLTTGELLKNYFFNESSISKYNELWKTTFDKDEECLNYWRQNMTTGRIKKDFSETFFYSYLQIKIQDPSLSLSSEAKQVYRRTEGLFNNYKTIIKDKELDINIIIKEITNYGKLFKEAFDADITKCDIPSKADIKRICFIIFVLDTSTLFPYVMYILKNVLEIDERNAIFDFLECYIVRRIICNSKNNNYSDLFSENLIGNEINTLAKLKEYISTKTTDSSLAMPNDEKIKEAFKQITFNNKRALGILYLMESKLRDNKHHSLALRPFCDYTLEHLMPKKWKNNWGNPVAPYTEEMRDNAICTLGNLAMITSKLNTSISNANWIAKVNGNQRHGGLNTYATGIEILKTALTKTKWDEDEIIERAELLSNYAIQIWKI